MNQYELLISVALGLLVDACKEADSADECVQLVLETKAQLLAHFIENLEANRSGAV